MAERTENLVGALAVAVMILSAVLVLYDSPRSLPYGVKRSSQPEPTRLVSVPDVVGMTALRARQRLLGVGLQFGKVLPTEGRPGEVMSTRPSEGHFVPRGTSVDLFVGAEEGRLESHDSPNEPSHPFKPGSVRARLFRERDVGEAPRS
jgi:beta-lactam-binding protein with PASTA domain